MMALHGDLETLAAQVPGELGFMLLDSQGVEVAGVNAGRSFTSASLYKLFVAAAVLEEVDRGRVELSDTVPGLGLSVDEALGEMISWSRNYPGAALGEWLGWSEIEAAAQDRGFESTTFDPDEAAEGAVEMTTTAADVAHFLSALDQGELLEPASSEVLIGYLADQHRNDALPRGLSSEVEFEHKTGLLEDVSHDAGILRLEGQDHVVAVLTDGWSGYEESYPWFQGMGTVLDGYLHASATATAVSTGEGGGL